MGGPGSGNWCRWSSKGTTEACNRIDIRYLKKQGSLAPGTIGTLSWSCGDEQTGSIRYLTCHDRIELIYRSREHDGEWEDVEYPVYFDETACNYGGTRKWFLCPNQSCSRRVAVLYGVGKYFVCRHCHNLAYSSQSENEALRAARKGRKIVEKLGGDPYSDFLPDKPKGMHWKTYNRLIREAEYYENLSWQYVEQWLGNFRAGIEAKR
mgnify:FL=1